jgi:dipeptidyl aminopeptidase/acylaminoacyl peptidase
MNEDRLRTLLRDEPLPGAADAKRRGLTLVERAYAERRPANRPVLPRLAVALAAAALLAALLLSPAGAAVRNWIGDVFTAGVRNAEPALTEVPGGGRLLVQSSGGPWVVEPDGSRRLLGRYDEASWSPHGLFVAAASGRTLSAIEPDGTPHWSLSAAGPVSDPRWSPSGFRIAYRAGRSLRTIRGDGTGGRLIGPAAPVAPVWFPPGTHLLAYVDAVGRLRIVEADTARTLTTVESSPGVTALGWAADGRALLEIAPHGLWLRRLQIDKLADSVRLGTARRIPLPGGAIVRAAAFAPGRRTIATLLERRIRTAAPRSEVLLIDPDGGPPRRLFAVSGRLTQLVWSPDGSRLLLAWPAADQWLFLPVGERGHLRAIGNIGAAFSPGGGGPTTLPPVAGWCCAPGPTGGG